MRNRWDREAAGALQAMAAGPVNAAVSGPEVPAWRSRVARSWAGTAGRLPALVDDL